MNMVNALERSVELHFPDSASDIKYFISTGTNAGSLPEWKVETMISTFRRVDGFKEFVLGFLGGDIHDLS